MGQVVLFPYVNLFPETIPFDPKTPTADCEVEIFSLIKR